MVGVCGNCHFLPKQGNKIQYYLVCAEILEPATGPQSEAEPGPEFQFSSPTHTAHSPAVKYRPKIPAHEQRNMLYISL